MVVPAKKYYADDYVHVASLRYHFWKEKVRAAQLMGITPTSRGTRSRKTARSLAPRERLQNRYIMTVRAMFNPPAYWALRSLAKTSYMEARARSPGRTYSLHVHTCTLARRAPQLYYVCVKSLQTL
jgi:hypothetical protein